MATGGDGRIRWRQVAAVSLGNALEFYDFLVYAFFAVPIATALFPPGADGAALIAALATFGVGFLTRPVGAVVLGRMGDRVGRRPAMLVSVSLIGSAAVGLALVPPYARIGMAAPVLAVFFRLLQGFGLGGEVGASTAFLIESAPAGRRGLVVSLQLVGQNAATLAAGLIGVALSALLAPAMLGAWGWRIAFLLGAALVPFGIVLRRTLPETLPAATAEAVAPAGYAAAAWRGGLLLLAGTVSTYVLNYMTTYAVATIGLPERLAFGATVVVGIAGVVFGLAGGLWADRLGRRPVMILPYLAMMVATWPCFWAIGRWRSAAALYAASAILRVPLAIAQSAALVHIAESLPARVRSGALAIIYAISISVFGGSTQFLLAWLIRRTGDPLVPAWYLLGAGVIGVLTALACPETAPDDARRPRR